jgi:hypothetical protein
MVAELEADLIRLRTCEGMAVAAKGRLRGKQPKLTPRQEAHLVRLHQVGGHASGELAELFGGGPIDGLPGAGAVPAPQGLTARLLGRAWPGGSRPYSHG